MGIITTLLVAAGLALVGESQEEEARKINDHTREIYRQCNERIENVGELVNAKSNKVNKKLAAIGNTSKEFAEHVLARYLLTVEEKYKNYNLVKEFDSEYRDYVFKEKLNYKSLMTNIKTVNGILSKKVSTKKAVAMTTIGAVGISAFTTAIGVKALTPTILGSSLLGSIPIAAGGSIAIKGILNKKKAIEDQKKALAYESKVRAYYYKGRGIAKGLNELDTYLTDSNEKIKVIIDNFCRAVASFEEFTECTLKKTGKKKIDAKKLDNKDMMKLYRIYILSQIAYGSINLPMITAECVADPNTQTRIQTNHEESIKLIGKIQNE